MTSIHPVALNCRREGEATESFISVARQAGRLTNDAFSPFIGNVFAVWKCTFNNARLRLVLQVFWIRTVDRTFTVYQYAINATAVLLDRENA